MTGFPGRRGAAAPAVLVLVALVLGTAACTPDQEPTPPPATTSAPTTAEPPTDLRSVLDVDFDQPGLTMGSGLGEGAPVPRNDAGPAGVVRLGGATPVEATVEPGAEGAGVRLATPCDPHEECPKAVLEFPDSPDLQPGTRDFRFGLSLLMTPDETSKGSNVVQKGFNNGGASQWKLQVDGEKGHASCVLVGVDPEHDWLVTGTETVADGTWHVLECRREAGTLTLLVDGEVDKSKPIDPATDVRPPSALRVGGKSLKPDNDQYFGVLDDIFVLVAP